MFDIEDLARRRQMPEREKIVDATASQQEAP
jgi:hypothetical protein